MAKITFIESDGAERTVDAVLGQSVMEAARKNNVSGIDAECGGACVCATCHVYLEDAWLSVVGEKKAIEAEMLEYAENVHPNSRLSCQIKVMAALDGLVVRVPGNRS